MLKFSNNNSDILFAALEKAAKDKRDVDLDTKIKQNIYWTKKQFYSRKTAYQEHEICYEDLNAEVIEYPLLEKLQIEETLNLLLPEQRAIFYLRCFQNYTYEETAKTLNISMKKVRYQYEKARKYLRDNYNKLVKPIWCD